MSKPNTIRIGLSMAGAISAGAYTAGVIDYLLEALENWQKAKELGLPVPKHDVVIEVISGASAGGMTAVITSAAIQKTFPHVNQQNYDTGAAKNNPLFGSWVNLTETSTSDMMSQMLANDDILKSPDINPKKEVRSIFNSLFIEKIARRTIDAIVKDPATKRQYIANDMELFTTVTNLRGFNYQLQFITAVGLREDRMVMHKDIIHFQLNQLGKYNDDGKIPINFDTVNGLNRNMLVDAAIATGAFPVGLSPRVVVRDPKYINDNPLLKITHGKSCIVNPLAPYNTVCVDGGVINNEPYDLTETLLANRRRAELKEDNREADSESYIPEISAATFDTTILSIDPFPNYDEQPDANYFDLMGLKFVAPALLGAMRQQLMLKADMLERSYSDNDYSRFMIAPIRTKKEVTQKYSIACGSLGGFGGFFERQFRVHDFMLGRRNCQQFLQQYFCVPTSAHNPIIDYGYNNLDAATLQLVRPKSAGLLPIIPDIRVSDDNLHIYKPETEGEYAYPAISLKYIMSLQDTLEKRFGVILNNVGNSNNPGAESTAINPVVKRIRKKSWFGRNIFGPLKNLGASGFISIAKSSGSSMAAEKFVDAVITDMSKRELLDDDFKN